MGEMLRQIVSPLHDLSYATDPFLLVSLSIIVSFSVPCHAQHMQT